MKRIVYLIIDLLIVFGSIVLAFYLLENVDMLQDFQANFKAFEIVTPFIAILYLILNYAFGLYKYNLTRYDLFEIIYTTFLISISFMIGIMGICFFVRDLALAFPRSVILLSTVFYFISSSIWHASFWFLLLKKHGTKKITIIGQDNQSLIDAINNKYHHLYKIENICSGEDSSLSLKIKSVDEVFISSNIPEKQRKQIFPLCFKYKKEISYIPNFLDLSVMASSLNKTDDIPTFRISTMELSPEERFVKRLFDLLFSSVAAIICFPIGIIISLFIKLDGGSVFYAQKRLTKEGKSFNILKFRTMIPDAEKKSGPVLAGENDPRITKIGKFIRAVRLDELPQLLNILRGDMSIVGPRPERPFFVEQFEKDMPEYQYRLKVKAGLTGLAQVEGKYNTSVEDKLLYDLIYINNYSVLKDFLIMLQTVKILFMKSSTEGVSQS